MNLHKKVYCQLSQEWAKERVELRNGKSNQIRVKEVVPQGRNTNSAKHIFPQDPQLLMSGNSSS